MLDINFADEIRSKIQDNKTYQDYKHYGANFSVPEDHGTIHISVIAPNGDAVAVTSSINTLYDCTFLLSRFSLTRKTFVNLVWDHESDPDQLV